MTDLLTASDVGVRLGGRLVLDGIGLTLAAGRITVLIGPNGSGKTTLLRSMLGHVPAGGDIAWLGRPLGEWSRKDLAKAGAYLPQSPQFEPGDRVIDVLRLGRVAHGGWLGLDAAADDAVIESVAADLAIAELLDRPVETLSGGQRQRVFLGRALAQRPKALLLDEPTTYLDLRHQVDFYELLGRLARGRGLSVLMSSHDVNLSLELADDAIVMKNGRVLASGAAKSVLNEATLSDAFDVIVRGVRDGERTVFVTGASSITRTA